MNTSASERLIHDLRTIINEADHLLHDAAAQTSDGVEAVQARGERALHLARRRMHVAERRAVQKLRRTARNADRFVHDEPWRVIGVAAGVGFVAGCLLGRR